MAPAAKWAASVCAPTALALGLDVMCYFGENGQAPTWSNAGVPVAGYSVSACLAALAADAALYTALALYLHETVPGGPDKPAPQAWHFPLSTPAGALLRLVARGAAASNAGAAQSHDSQVVSAEDAASAASRLPPAVERLDPAVFRSSLRVSVRHVTKRYAVAAAAAAAVRTGSGSGVRSPRPAVDDVSIDLLPGQVTVLLGHNGERSGRIAS